MRLWHVLRTRTASLLFRRRREAELHEELQQHIERETERLRAMGIAPEAARQHALRTFGGVEQIKEVCRDARGTGAIDAVSRDTRHAARRLARDWRFTVAAVLTLGLGIGANTAIFSLVNATLFRPPVVADPGRLVDLYQNGSNPGGIDGNSYPGYLDMADRTDVFAGVTAALVPLGVSYLDAGALRPALAEHTTANYLSVLGLEPSLGRWFTAAEDSPGAAVVAVLGREAWTTKFRADPSVVGRTIRMQGVPVTIVGVGPAGHRGTVNIGLVTDFWLPIASLPAFGMPSRALTRRPDEAAFNVKARLRDGVTVAQAQAAMRILGTRLAAEYPKEDAGKGISVFASSDVRIHPQMDGVVRVVASILLVVVGLVLAIACTNLATLLLVRGTARAREVSVRLALGATRRQLVRFLLTESLLLAVAGCVAGCLLAWWATRSLAAVDLPIVVDLSLDYRVLGFAAAISAVTGVAFGLAPALKATRVDVAPTLRGGETRASDSRWLTLKNALVVFQVAVSVALLGGTSLFLQMLSASRTVRAGFAVDGVAMLETDTRYAGYSDADARNALEEIRRRIAASPGVQAAVLTRGLPLERDGYPVVVEGATTAAGADAGSRRPSATWAGPGYFDALRMAILHGRALDERDRLGAPRVAVISETMARDYFGAGDPSQAVGRRFRLERDTDANAWIEVVGVARDVRTDLIEHRPQVFYRSFAQWGLTPTTVVARTSLDAAGLAGTMQRELRGVNAGLPVVSARTMVRYLEESLVAPKAVATFLAGLGAVGLGLAGIGLYAVIAFAVARRSREIGIRMALGAQRVQAVWAVARDVAVLVGVGTGAGLTLTLLAILALRAVVVPTPGITVYRPTADPLALLTIAAFMAVVGVTAACVPARRAAMVDPLVALRRD
jgi:predicted permease